MHLVGLVGVSDGDVVLIHVALNYGSRRLCRRLVQVYA